MRAPRRCCGRRRMRWGRMRRPCVRARWPGSRSPWPGTRSRRARRPGRQCRSRVSQVIPGRSPPRSVPASMCCGAPRTRATRWPVPARSSPWPAPPAIRGGLVAGSHLSTAHAAALVLIEAEHGAWDQARGRFGELATAGVAEMRPDMVYVWALALLAHGCCMLGSRQHAMHLYQALLPFADRAAVAAGAVMCAGSVSRYLGGLAALSGDIAAAEEHFQAAIAHHRRLGARPLLARTLHEY